MLASKPKTNVEGYPVRDARNSVFHVRTLKRPRSMKNLLVNQVSHTYSANQLLLTVLIIESMAPQVPPWGVPYDGKSALPPIASLRNPGIDQSGHLSTNQPTGQGLVRRRNPIARSHGPASFASAAQNTISYGSYYAGASSNAWAAQTNTDQAAPNYLGTSGTAMVDTRWPQQGLRVANAQFQRNLPQVAMGFDGGARSNHATALNTIPTKWSGGYVEPEEVDDGIPFDLKLTDTNQATESYLGTLGTNLVGRQWPRQYFPVNDAGFQGNLSGTMTTAPKYQLPIRQQGMDVTDYAPLIDPNLLVSPFGSEKQTEHHETDPDHRGTNYIDPYSSNTDYTDYSGNNYR